MNHADMKVVSDNEQFDAMIAQAEAEKLVAEFGSDEALEARVSRRSTAGVGC